MLSIKTLALISKTYLDNAFAASPSLVPDFSYCLTVSIDGDGADSIVTGGAGNAAGVFSITG